MPSGTIAVVVTSTGLLKPAIDAKDPAIAERIPFSPKTIHQARNATTTKARMDSSGTAHHGQRVVGAVIWSIRRATASYVLAVVSSINLLDGLKMGAILGAAI